MEKSNIHLEFHCPKKWNEMSAQDDGRFCNDCRKIVADHSKVSIDKLSSITSIDDEKEVCGSFYAYQLDKPFHNHKDKLISFYKRTIHNTTISKLIKPAVLFSIMTMLLLTGCARRLQGRYSTKAHKIAKRAPQTTQITAENE